MKKRLLLTLSMATLCLAVVTVRVDAEESLDHKIANEEKNINSLSNKKQISDQALSEIENNINALMAEVNVLLDEKVQLEQEQNKLIEEIQALEAVIQKRSKKIAEQAREAQVAQEDEIISVLLESKSITDAINRTIAYTKLMSASNDILEMQKIDQEKLTVKKEALKNKITAVNEKTIELQGKQKDLEQSKTEQLRVANEILKELESAQGKKEELLSQKAAAEKIAQENAAKEKEVAELMKQAKAAEEQSRKELEKAQQNDPSQLTSLGKVSSKPGTSDNSQTDVSNVSSAGFQSPIAGGLSVSSGFGGRNNPTGYGYEFHNGIDLTGPANTPILAARAGVVVESSFHPSAGNHVIVLHDNGYYTYYLHLSQPGVASGTAVQAGQTVGLMGTTGNSTGVHLHFGISTALWSGFMDPAPFIGLY